MASILTLTLSPYSLSLFLSLSLTLTLTLSFSPSHSVSGLIRSHSRYSASMRATLCIMQRVVTGKLDVSCKWYDMSIVLTDFASYTFIMNTCHMSHMPFSYRLLFRPLSCTLPFPFSPCTMFLCVYAPPLSLSPARFHHCLLAFLQFSFQFEFFTSISYNILFIRSSSIWCLCWSLGSSWQLEWRASHGTRAPTLQIQNSFWLCVCVCAQCVHILLAFQSVFPFQLCTRQHTVCFVFAVLFAICTAILILWVFIFIYLILALETTLSQHTTAKPRKKKCIINTILHYGMDDVHSRGV